MNITTKQASNSPVTFVTHKRFGVLFLLPSCCVNSLLAGESWLRGAQGVMGRTKERKLVFLLITPRTFFVHASRVFSACNPIRDTWGLVSCKPAICRSVHFCRKWYLLLRYFYSRIKAKRKTHLKGTQGMIYACLNGWFWCHRNYPIRGQIIYIFANVMQLWSQIRFIYHQWASIANSESRISKFTEVCCKMCDVIEIIVKN